jgi:hypothetical protein
VSLRDYTTGEIEQFLEDDQLDAEAGAVARRFRPTSTRRP